MSYFSKLNYTLGDEDTISEYSIIPNDCENVISISGSGGRVVPLIGKHPKVLTCVDVLQEQLDLTMLRIESIKQLNYYDFMRLLGYPEHPVTNDNRKKIFDTIILDNDVKSRLIRQFECENWGPIIYQGEFEKMLIKLSKLIRFILGDSLDRLFGFDDLVEQRRFFDSKYFPSKRWNLAILIFGNGVALNTLLYRGDFPKKNLEGSTYSCYKKMFEYLFRNVLCKESFFLQMLLLGKLKNSQESMLEADEEIFNSVKLALDSTKVYYQKNDIVSAIRDNLSKFDFVSMSDVPSFMVNGSENSFLLDISDNLLPECKVVTRGHLRITNPDYFGYDKIKLDELNLPIEKTSLWKLQCYSKI
jgi:S-adenosylmethionine-diacylglycerol 3-amino-3-carboxypropyl transferase